MIAELEKRPKLRAIASVPVSGRSKLEIVRCLANPHYCAGLLDFLEQAVTEAGSIGKALLQQTDTFQFEARLAEVYLHYHLKRSLVDSVATPSAGRAVRQPDLIVRICDLEVAIEIYSPRDLQGFQLVVEHVKSILRYLEVDAGYWLEVAIEPDERGDVMFALDVEEDRVIRPWLGCFAKEASLWLAKPPDEAMRRFPGPAGLGWRVMVKINKWLDMDRERLISLHTATRSDDPRQMFDGCRPAATAGYWWGRRVKAKMAERQAGSSPQCGRIRMLVIDFSALDTGFPGFFLYPHIAEQIDGAVRIISGEIDPPLPYDVVLPAELGIVCQFGHLVWLGEQDEKTRKTIIDTAQFHVSTKCT
ncbi:MAG: hypothetical protein HQ481_20205 [Alphaproteobacteria bacterium]|nr:hypothetical protein [Alphaproteobacteria bacterium]